MLLRFCEPMFALPLALLALIGCESPQWAKLGATTNELRRDLADCERFAPGPTPFHFWALGLSDEAARNRIAEREVACMNERGWMPTAGLVVPLDDKPTFASGAQNGTRRVSTE